MLVDPKHSVNEAYYREMMLFCAPEQLQAGMTANWTLEKTTFSLVLVRMLLTDFRNYLKADST